MHGQAQMQARVQYAVHASLCLALPGNMVHAMCVGLGQSLLAATAMLATNNAVREDLQLSTAGAP